MAASSSSNELPIEGMLSQEFRAAIGSLIIQCSALEFVMSNAAADLIGDNDDSRLAAFATVNGMEVRVKLGILKTLVEIQLPEDARGEFKTWSKEVELIVAQRHAAAHSFWMPSKEEGEYAPASFKTVGGLKGAIGTMNANDFRQWAGRAHNAMIGLPTLIEKHGRSTFPKARPKTP